MNLENIRNFAIISHIDHGKSTLADRLLELTETVSKREMKEQFLDSMELEREKGITIKMRPVRMIYHSEFSIFNFQFSNKSQIPNSKHQNSSEVTNSKQEFVLNLIDTPGHTDFSYEVSRALAAAEGAVLLVDASQGIQAQTIANLEMAKKLNLTILPVINKIDLKDARIEETKKEIIGLLKCEEDEILEISAKYGTGVKKLVETIIKKIPPPRKTRTDADFPRQSAESPRALIFDFEYSPHKGILAFIRVFDGIIKKDDELRLAKAGIIFKAKEIGYLSPDYQPQDKISSGDIAYLVTNLKESRLPKFSFGKFGQPSIVKVGDSVTSVINPLPALPGYKEIKPVVWSNFFPVSQARFEEFKKALEKLALNDSAFSFEEISIPSVGRGYRLGFLGTLHLEIVKERIKREFKIETINTLPSVVFLIKYKQDKSSESSAKEEKIYSANNFPEDFEIAAAAELWVNADILIPEDKFSAISQTFKEYECVIEKVENFSGNRLIIKIIMPLRELMRGFFDSLKSVSSGYASFSYELNETEKNWRPAEITKLDILINEEAVPALNRIVPLHRLYKEAEGLVEKLKTFLPPALYVLKIQAKAKGRIIASRSISALKKNVTGYLYGGDRTRKMKLWQKQKKGKEKLKEKGRYTIPADVFLKVMK